MGVTESQMAISCHQMSLPVPGLGGQGDLMEITMKLSVLWRQWIAGSTAKKNTHITHGHFIPCVVGRTFVFMKLFLSLSLWRLVLVTRIWRQWYGEIAQRGNASDNLLPLGRQRLWRHARISRQFWGFTTSLRVLKGPCRTWETLKHSVVCLALVINMKRDSPFEFLQ